MEMAQNGKSTRTYNNAPVIGWLDEIASLAILVQKMSKYITPEMEIKADEQLDKWFQTDTEYVEFEMIEG